MQNKQYKYKIDAHYKEFPRGISIGKVLKKHGISERTFYEDKRIVVSSSRDIPAGRLLKYAAIFNVTVSELFNYTAERKTSTVAKKVVASAKLSKA